ncbi:hypothetical protein BH09PAT4_BH09PAT4_04690 [soil metagenome]
MGKYNIPRREQLPLIETAVRAGKQKLEFFAGGVIGAVFGAVEGAKNGIMAVHEQQIEEGREISEIEQFANARPEPED